MRDAPAAEAAKEGLQALGAAAGSMVPLVQIQLRAIELFAEDLLPARLDGIELLERLHLEGNLAEVARLGGTAHHEIVRHDLGCTVLRREHQSQLQVLLV